MTVSRSPMTTVALGVCCAALGWLVYSEATIPVRLPPLAAPAGVDPEQARAKPEPVMPPIRAFTEMVARPLFIEGRRPTKAEQPVRLTKPVEINIMLTGIIIGDAEKIAHLKEYRKTRVHALHEGDTISQWRVETILEDRVIIRAGQRTESLFLNAAQPAATAAKRAKIPPLLPPPRNVPRSGGQDRREEGRTLQ